MYLLFNNDFVKMILNHLNYGNRITSTPMLQKHVLRKECDEQPRV